MVGANVAVVAHAAAARRSSSAGKVAGLAVAALGAFVLGTLYFTPGEGRGRFALVRSRCLPSGTRA